MSVHLHIYRLQAHPQNQILPTKITYYLAQLQLPLCVPINVYVASLIQFETKYIVFNFCPINITQIEYQNLKP